MKFAEDLPGDTEQLFQGEVFLWLACLTVRLHGLWPCSVFSEKQDKASLDGFCGDST